MPTSTALFTQLDLCGASLSLPLERLFDDLSNLVFFIKDREGRYLAVNRTLVERCGFSAKAQVLGRRPSDFFPQALAARYERQDRRVITTGRPMVDSLELHLYPSRLRGWALSNKYPVRDARTGEIAGIVGITRDVETSPRGVKARGFPELAAALEQVQARIDDPPEIEELAAACGLSAHRFSQLVRQLFHLTPRQLVMKVRIDEALYLLTTTGISLADIALATGFCDQAAFTRHFHRLTGLPPGAFRTKAAGGTPGSTA